MLQVTFRNLHTCGNKGRHPRYLPPKRTRQRLHHAINTSAQDSTPKAHTQSSEVDNTQSSWFSVSKNNEKYLRSCKKAYPTSISRNASSSRKLSTSTPAQFQMSSPTSRNLQASSILGHHKVLYDRCYSFRNQVSLLYMVFYELIQLRDILTCSPPIPSTEPCPQYTLSKHLLNEYSYAKSIIGNRRLELIRPNKVQRRGASSIDISANSKSKSPSWNSESERGC